MVQVKKLYRSKKNRVIAGICGGLGEYLNFDSNIIRVITVVLAFAGGLGVLAYLVSWIIIPESPR